MKKHFKIVICAILAIAMLMTAVSCETTASDDGRTSEAASELASFESSSSELAEGQSVGGQTLENQPGVSESESSERATENGESGKTGITEDVPAEKKDIMILFTSDVHCGYDQGFGYAGLEQIRKHLQSQGYDVILVDNGDNFQGELIGSLTKGEIPVDLMNRMGYSVATLGNHEFDHGVDQLLKLAGKAEFSYIACNFQCRGEDVFDPYVIRQVGGRKVGFVGVTTPETITTSSPHYFQDLEGNYIYSFLQDETGEALYNAVQTSVDAAREEGAEYVIILGHLGNAEKSHPWTYADVISHTSGIDAFLDGHSHDKNQITMNDKEGESVLRSGCGTRLNGIGWCEIPVEGEISTGVYSWTLKDAAPDVFEIENEMSAAVREAKDKLEKQLQETVGYSTVDLTINDPKAVDADGHPIRMVRRAETNMGDLCADAFRTRMGADVAIISGGNIRENFTAGKVKMYDVYKVMPFQKEGCMIRVTGQQILDALEWGTHAFPDESGGFLQVSGMSYEIHSYLDSTCTQDADGMFNGITGERRVKNVRIGGKLVDPEAYYTLASTAYVVLQNEYGHTAFDGAERLTENGPQEHNVVIDYIRDDLGGVIGEEYSDLTGQGRIVVVEEEPVDHNQDVP